MEHFEHKFYRIGLAPFSRKPKEDYQEVVARMAKDGWRLVQIFAPPVSGYGAARFFELIFQRKRS